MALGRSLPASHHRTSGHHPAVRRSTVAASMRARTRGHLLRLGIGLGLRPFCRATVAAGDLGALYEFLWQVGQLAVEHPGRQAVLIRTVYPDGVEPIFFRASTTREFRRSLARLVLAHNRPGLSGK